MGLATILIVITVFSSLSIIVLALMQTSKGDMGSAFGGGGSQSMFGSRGSANFLSRTTSVMVVVFFLSCLSLAYIYAQRNESTSVVSQSVLGAQPTNPSEVPVLEDEPINDAVSELPQLDSELPAIEATDSSDIVEPDSSTLSDETSSN
jgi:preprotein translocase subunit SecG